MLRLREHLIVPASEPIVICDFDPSWPARFQTIGESLRARLGDAVLRIDHIGSTSVPDLPAKDLIDVQLTVRELEDADRWPDELVQGLIRRPGITADHVPAGAPTGSTQWAKRYWSERQRLHVHVRQEGRLTIATPSFSVTTCALTGALRTRTGSSSARSQKQLATIGTRTTQSKIQRAT